METCASPLHIGLGQFIRNIRSQNKIKRFDLSITSGIEFEVIERIEHGDIRKEDRFVILRIIKNLVVKPQDQEKIGRFLKALYRRRRVKFHLSPSILSHRRGFIRRR